MKQLTLIWLLVLPLVGVAQQFDWAVNVGGPRHDYGYNLAVDANGFVYTVGIFRDTADFDPGPGTAILFADWQWTDTHYDSFIAKWTPNGELVWAKRLHGPTYVRCISIDVDSFGNVYTTGYFEEFVDLDPGPGFNNIYSNGDRDIFISKLDTDGNYVWGKTMGGASWDHANSIKVDENGDFFLLGLFRDSIDIDPGPNEWYLDTYGYTDIFFAKFNADGDLYWAKSVGGTGSDRSGGLDIDGAGNIYISGEFRYTADLDPGPDTHEIINESGYPDVFVSKYDESGNYIWAKHFHSPEHDNAYSLEVSEAGNVHLFGMFSGILTAEFNPNTLYMVDTDGYYYMAKLDTDANILWARQSKARLYDSYLDNSENVYVASIFDDTVNLEQGTDMYQVTPINIRDFLVFKLTNHGDYEWARSFGSAGFSQPHITMDPSGALYTFGSCHSTSDFDPGSDTFNITSNGSIDAVLQKMSVCTGPVVSLDTLVCNSYTSPTGNILTTTGSYMDTVAFFFTCDSVYAIDLTVVDLDNSVTLNPESNSITSNTEGVNYQWLDCVNGNEPIIGDTDQTFTPSANGSYAVALEQFGCVDTSECFLVENVGLNELIVGDLILYPNPTTSTIRIQLPENNLSATRTSLYDISGRLVHQQPFNHNMDVGYLDRGTYIVVVETEEGNFRGTVIKE